MPSGWPSSKINQLAIVCKEASLKGEVTIGANTVVHPNVRILAEGGPIIIGEDNLIKEGTTIINKSACVHACACVHVCVCIFYFIL